MNIESLIIEMLSFLSSYAYDYLQFNFPAFRPFIMETDERMANSFREPPHTPAHSQVKVRCM